MEVLDSMEIRTRAKSVNGFHKVDGVVFCKTCGSQFNKSDLNGSGCPVCENVDFITGDFASTLAGYIKLDKAGTLKKYYNEAVNRKFSAVKMNNKRIIYQLLIRDRFVKYTDKEMEKVINRVMWRKF